METGTTERKQFLSTVKQSGQWNLKHVVCITHPKVSCSSNNHLFQLQSLTLPAIGCGNCKLITSVFQCDTMFHHPQTSPHTQTTRIMFTVKISVIFFSFKRSGEKNESLINLAERNVIKRIRYECSYTKKMASYYHHVAAHAFLT